MKNSKEFNLSHLSTLRFSALIQTFFLFVLHDLSASLKFLQTLQNMVLIPCF